MAFAVSRPARHSLRCLTTRQASLPLRTVQLLPHKGFRRWAPARPVSRPNRQPATGLPGDYPDRTFTGRRRRASDQVMIAGRSPPSSLDAPAALLDARHRQRALCTRQKSASPIRSAVRDRAHTVRMPVRYHHIVLDATTCLGECPGSSALHAHLTRVVPVYGYGARQPMPGIRLRTTPRQHRRCLRVHLRAGTVV